MATKIIKAQITQRHDTRSNWESVNPVLLEGELGLVSDDPNLYKVGDGRTEWNNLPYRGFDGTLSQEEGTSANAVMSQKAVTEALAKKPDTTGYYPSMQVGKADDLSGHGESVPAEFTFRASGGKSIKDGSATIKEMQGNAVVWNNAFAVVVDGNVPFPQGHQLHKGHKYLILANQLDGYGLCLFTRKDSQNIYIAEALNANNGFHFFTSEYDAISTGKAGEENSLWWYVEGSYAQANLIDLTLMYGAGNEPTTIEEYNARKPIVEDEYAYNEGEVIAFNGDAVKSVGDNAWDEQWEVGSIGADNGELNDNASYFRSKNFNRMLGGKEYTLPTTYDATFIVLYDEDYQYIDYWNMYVNAPRTILTDERTRYFKVSAQGRYDGGIMVRLTHSGWKDEVEPTYQPYWEDVMPIDSRIREAFPNGMHKWDKVYNKDGKGYIVKGTGSVDLGDYDIIPSSCHNWEHRWLIGPLNSIKPIQVNSDKAGMISVFPLGSADSTYLSENGIGLDTERDIWLYDSRYTNRDDIDNVRQMLQGVMLYYELAEPTIIEYDKPFKLDYKVADFGTEELLTSQPSAPFKGRTIYQFNAVDQIRDNANRIAQLEALLTAMQAQITSLTNNPE